MDDAGWASHPANEQSQEQNLLDGVLQGEVRRLVARLPVPLRDALLLASAGEYTYREIAQMLGIPDGTLKWRVAEARRRLRRTLEGLGYGTAGSARSRD